MRNLKTIEGKVKAILQKDEEARNDDMTLYLKVCKMCIRDRIYNGSYRESKVPDFVAFLLSGKSGADEEAV